MDHEEHQRKEAEEKKKQQSAAAGSGETASPTEAVGPLETQSRPGPGPSILDTRSSLQASSSSILSSSPSSNRSVSPSPKHAKVGSQDSLAPGRKSWSISRSRTPPPPANPVPNLPVSEENQAAWRSKTTGPPAFSTLSAALSSTSTAAAFLGAASSNEPRSVTPEPGSGIPVTSSMPLAGSSIPTITVVNNDRESGITTTRGQGDQASRTDVGPSSTSSYPPAAIPSNDPHLPRDASEVNGVVQVPSAISTITILEDPESGAGIGFGSHGHPPSSSESDIDMSCDHSMGLLNSTTKVDGQVDSGTAAVSTSLDEHSR